MTMGERFGTSGTGASADSSAKSKLTSLAATTGDQMAEAADQVKEAANVQLDKLADAIRSRPIQATGIAAGVGFLLAVLARR